jgi:hypothetical protein
MRAFSRIILEKSKNLQTKAKRTLFFARNVKKCIKM